jgi:NAD(P) transhydrogenase subunit alpha
MPDSVTSAAPLTVGVPKESFPGERRVALVPASLKALAKANIQVQVESGAGDSAGFPDSEYIEAGATIQSSRQQLFADADIILQVRACGANLDCGIADIDLLKSGQTLIATSDPLSEPESLKPLADKGVTGFALELLPRITRAQSMDILSSMATVAGYKAVMITANALPRMFPMMMTAAGTVKPAKVLVVGAGVAGLQAISAAKRLGAIVFGYDIRPAVKEQVESLGGKFVELELETGSSEQSGGYAKEMGEDFYRKQRELMTKVVADCNAVITTAAIPGKIAPILITQDMVEAMKPGSVIVDLAAERGGNCEVTEPGKTINHHGVEVHGPTNLAATIPYHASEMFAKNISTFLLNLVDDGKLNFNLDDEIIRDTLVTRDGEIVNARVREILGLPALAVQSVAADSNPADSTNDSSKESST